jgi:pimeloyl-ACP methyl ester carboxylesterase
MNNSKVLLMPGFDGTGELFEPLLAVWGIDATIIRYQSEHSFEDYVESVAALVPEENAVLVAESFSGPVALALMSRYPERILCSVLCATFAVSPFRLLTRMSRFVTSVFFGPGPTQPMMLRTFCFDKEADSALVSKAVSVIRSVPASVIKSRLKVLSDVDMRLVLSRIKVPVLYLLAVDDKIVAPSLSQQLVQGLPNVRLHKVKGPHMLLQSRPEDCAEIIRSFIEDM